ncbi:MAG: nucleoside deaminase [Rhodothermales bacterium]
MKFTEKDRAYMRIAMEMARKGVESGQSPFGACIVNGNGKVIAQAHNEVVRNTDVTAHAEVQAIRLACRAVNSIDLSGCTIYSTCEPCPMCFAACHWAKLDRVVYGASIKDAQGAGFNEMTISNLQMRELGGSSVEVDGGCLSEENESVFRAYIGLPNRIVY